MYGLVESIFVIYTSPYNAGNERVLKKYFQGALFLCLRVGRKKNDTLKLPVYRETLIDLNVSISFSSYCYDSNYYYKY